MEHSLIIHMRGDEKRAPNVRVLLDSLPGAQVMDAVRGREVVERGECHPHPGNLHKPTYPFPLSGGEVGCFLSHRSCWQRILDEGWDMALIVEDDLALEPVAWADALALIDKHATPDHFIRLPAKTREKSAKTLAKQGEARLFLPRIPGLQTVAQVVGRNAAEKVLNATRSLDRPVDTFLQMHWVHGQPIHTILPNGVSELTAELGGSTIQKKTRTNGKLEREFKRAVYRTIVSMRPQRA
ncbi:MAG: glycosyl transferase family 25 [Rhodobacteraceae bacterium]|nr:glycosyl transferase family 25 [Paracoccaceae bacterium]